MLLCEQCEQRGGIFGGAMISQCRMGKRCRGNGKTPNTAIAICLACAEHYAICQQCGEPLPDFAERFIHRQSKKFLRAYIVALLVSLGFFVPSVFFCYQQASTLTTVFLALFSSQTIVSAGFLWFAIKAFRQDAEHL